MIKVVILYICFLIQSYQQNPQIFINYGVDREGIQLYKFFHKNNNGFYVDIGCYDSIFASNTLNLQTMGWTGINVDANPERLARFIYSRPWEPSLNFAIGDQDQFVTLYQLAEDSSSTISPKVKDFVKGYKPLVKQISTPSITMKQLCQRFFYRKPIFLNLDIEGVGAKALQSNDWNNSNCVPQIIFSQINQQAIQSGLPLPQKILQMHGYKKWNTNVGLNQIYIHSSVYQKYSSQYNQGTNLIRNKSIVNVGTIGVNIARTLGLNTILATHHEPKTDNMFYHFTKPDQIIDIYQLNKYSNKISNIQDRPIVIFHFHPQNNEIIMRYEIFQTSYFQIAATIQFYVILIKKDNAKTLNVFILNHFFNTTEKPRILKPDGKTLSSNHQHEQFPQQILFKNSSNKTINEKLFLSIQNQLKQLNEITNRTKKEQEKNIKQLMQVLSTNYNNNAKQIQVLLKKMQNIELFNKQIQSQTVSSQLREASLPTKQNIAKVMRIGILLLFIIFFTMLIVNVIICIAYQQGKQVTVQKKNRKGSKVHKNRFQPINEQTVLESPHMQSQNYT